MIVGTGLVVGLILVRDVTDVPVSPSSVVTEMCGASPCFSDWSLVEPQSFFFFQEACTLLYSVAGRDEV